jgi:DNA polymerase-1
MIQPEAEPGAAGMETQMLLQIHDELILQSAPGEIERAIDLTRQVMEHIAELHVP